MRTKAGFFLKLILSSLSAVTAAKLSATAAGLDGKSAATENIKPGALLSLSKLPMSFERNDGQFTDDIQFRSHGASYSVVLRATEAVLLLGDTKVPNHAELLKQRRARAKRGSHH